MEVAIMNKFREMLVTLNAPLSLRMAVDQGQLFQSFGEDVEVAVRPAPGSQRPDAEGENPAPCSGPGSEHQDRWSLQGPINTTRIRTDSG